MGTGFSYPREMLAEAVASSHSSRGVLRHLRCLEHSAGALRAVRREVAAFGIDHSHFTGQRRWSDRQGCDRAVSQLVRHSAPPGRERRQSRLCSRRRGSPGARHLALQPSEPRRPLRGRTATFESARCRRALSSRSSRTADGQVTASCMTLARSTRSSLSTPNSMRIGSGSRTWRDTDRSRCALTGTVSLPSAASG